MQDSPCSAVVLLSGGLDSSVLLHYVTKKLAYSSIYVLSFQYGQKHTKELEMAKWQVKQISQVIEHKIIMLDFFPAIIAGSSSLVSGGTEVPDLQDLNDEQLLQPSTYVPNRNMILLSLAAAYAEGHNCENIYYGAQAHDQYGYWDCTQKFIDSINQILSLNRKKKVRIIAPFANLSKGEEVKIGIDLGVDFSHTWSCYKGGNTPCMSCPTCIERINAFKYAKITDPLISD